MSVNVVSADVYEKQEMRVELSIEARPLSILTQIGGFLADRDIRAYLVGGFLRDTLLGRTTADIDIAIMADMREIAPAVAEALGGQYVFLDEENGVGRVIIPCEVIPADKAQWQVDFSTMQGSLEQDLARRDFTVNAMAVDLNQLKNTEEAEVVDLFGGWDDLGQKVIRAVAEGAFALDPLRLLRAVRLAAELDFRIDEETMAHIRHDSQLLSNVAGERVREELARLLAASHTGQSFASLDELGLLGVIIPELEEGKGVAQPKEHHWDVFVHSLRTVSAVEFLLRQGDWRYAGEEILNSIPWSPELVHYFDQEVGSGNTRGSLVKLAALLHDIAKPQTKAFDTTGKMRFLGHAEEGASRVVSILKRLRFSGKEIKFVEPLVKYHLRPLQMSHEGLPTRRAIYRFFRDAGDAGIAILFLSLADHLAARGPDLELQQWQEHVHVVEYVIRQHSEEEKMVAPPKLVDGHDLMNIFGLSPGPEIGEILEALRETQAAGELNTREEALNYVRELLISKVGN